MNADDFGKLSNEALIEGFERTVRRDPHAEWGPYREALLSRMEPTTEYQTTRASGPAVGIDVASVPVPPEGDGWELVSASCTGSQFFYWWRR